MFTSVGASHFFFNKWAQCCFWLSIISHMNLVKATLNFIHLFWVMFLIFPALGWCDRNSVEYPASSHSRISWLHRTCRLPSRVSNTNVHLGIMGGTLCQLFNSNIASNNTEILYRTDWFLLLSNKGTRWNLNRISWLANKERKWYLNVVLFYFFIFYFLIKVVLLSDFKLLVFKCLSQILVFYWKIDLFFQLQN